MDAKCIGYDPKEFGLKKNCANCRNWEGNTCLVKDILNELYEESAAFMAFDRMMRSNRGIQL